MNIPAIKLEQNGKIFYLFTMRAKLIYQRFAVSRRIDDKEAGYQRSFSKTRINQIKKYVDKDKGILPNSILVNIDEGKYSFNKIKLKMN
jgi:DGQHR domain-containing protein